MKNKNYSPHYVREAINDVFNESGRQEIPNITSLCAITKASRETIIHHLNKWWHDHDFLHQNGAFLSSIPALNKSQTEEMELIQKCLNSIIQEMELHHDLLNRLPTAFPLGNYVVQSLEHIQQKLDDLVVYSQQNQEIHEELELALTKIKQEHSRSLEIIQQSSKKKTAELKVELDNARREIAALRAKLSSFKKQKRHSLLYKGSIKYASNS